MKIALLILFACVRVMASVEVISPNQVMIDGKNSGTIVKAVADYPKLSVEIQNAIALWAAKAAKLVSDVKVALASEDPSVAVAAVATANAEVDKTVTDTRKEWIAAQIAKLQAEYDALGDNVDALKSEK